MLGHRLSREQGPTAGKLRVAKVPNLKICRKGKATTFGKSIAIRPEGNKRMHKGQWQRKLVVICIYIYSL